MDPNISMLEDEAQLANMVMDNRSSDASNSSPGFNFSLNPRKNLKESFDNEVSCLSKDHVVAHAVIESKSVAAAVVPSIPGSVRPPLYRNQSSRRHIGDGMGSSHNRVAVYLRIRPPPPVVGASNSNDESGNTIEILDDTNEPGRFPTRIRTYPPALSNTYRININRSARDLSAYAKEFTFECVMGPQTSQKTVYSAVAAPMIHDLFSSSLLQEQVKAPGTTSSTSKLNLNESALLFSYGITNAGKTHTVLGDLNSKNQSNWGIIPRAISDVFEQMRLQSTSASTKGPPLNHAQPPSQFQLHVSYFEIYNEQVYDLMPSKKTLSKHPFGQIAPLKVRECRGQTLVRGLAKHRVINTEHGIELTKQAHNKRHTSSNNLNTDSSRSHFVCQMQIVPMTTHAAAKMSDDEDDVSVASMSGYSTDEEVSSQSKQKISTIWIVDLAGSERSKRTQVSSIRQKESTLINKSLMTLMRCLNGIKDHGRYGTSSSSIIPFRESKLTHVFMSHLTSSSAARTAIMVNVNPAFADFDETQHVLAYATKAKLIEMDPEEFSRKRKQQFGEEYDINGRKKRDDKASPSKRSPPRKKKTVLSRLAKKLSPKRVFQKSVPKMAESERTEFLPVTTTHEDMSFEVASLKAELQAANAQVLSLQDANSQLVDELETKEDQIRSEVAIELEERLRETRMRHQAKYELLQSQIGQGTSETAFAVKMNKAEKQLEELMDKVDECETEMLRMNQDHTNEVNTLQDQITQLKARLTEATIDRQYDQAKIEALESKIEEYEQLIQKVETKSSRQMKVEDENQAPIAQPSQKSIEDDEDDENSNSSAEPLNFTLNVAKKSYRRKLRPRKALRTTTTNVIR